MHINHTMFNRLAEVARSFPSPILTSFRKYNGFAQSFRIVSLNKMKNLRLAFLFNATISVTFISDMALIMHTCKFSNVVPKKGGVMAMSGIFSPLWIKHHERSAYTSYLWGFSLWCQMIMRNPQPIRSEITSLSANLSWLKSFNDCAFCVAGPISLNIIVYSKDLPVECCSS